MSDSSRYVSSTDALVTTATDDPATISPGADAGSPGSTAGSPGAPESPAGAPIRQDGQPEAPADAPAATAPATPSAAEARFQSCRWRKPETPPFCSHPEVQPFAGTNGFKPEAWCPGCAFYKLRRNPRRDY